MIRAFQWDNPVALTVFQGGAYHVLKLELGGRRLGVNLLPFPGGKP